MTKIVSPVEALELFLNVNTYEEMNSLMTRVVNLEVPSPLYRLEPVTEENTDNNWWHKDDPRYQLLKQINELGIITLGAQEDVEIPTNIHPYFKEAGILAINTSADLIFCDPINIMNKLYEKLKNDAFITIIQNTDIQDMEQKEFILDITTYKDLTQEANPTIVYESEDGKYYSGWKHYVDFEPVLNKEFYKYFSKLPCFRVNDLVLNRSPDHPGGVFTKIVEYLHEINKKTSFKKKEKVIPSIEEQKNLISSSEKSIDLGRLNSDRKSKDNPDSYTLTELKSFAKKMNIPKYSTMNKAELVETIRNNL